MLVFVMVRGCMHYIANGLQKAGSSEQNRCPYLFYYALDSHNWQIGLPFLVQQQQQKIKLARPEKRQPTGLKVKTKTAEGNSF
jgi:hypothetical protein